MKKIILYLLLFVAVERFCHYQTEGFRLYKVQADIPHRSAWETSPLTAEEQQSVEANLDQTFHYLGSGLQCYAFVSADQKTVLKLFKHHHINPSPWYARLPLPEKLASRLDIFLKKRKQKFETLFASAIIAHEKFKENSGFIYVHLNPTESWKKRVTIVDKIGIAHTLDLDKTQYILQKKADPVFKTIDRFAKEGNLDKIRTCFSSIATLIREQDEKGIRNHDTRTDRDNIGFIDQRAIIIDTGQFKNASETSSPNAIRREIVNAYKPLKEWLNDHHPDLIPYLDEAFMKLRSEHVHE